MCSTRVADRTAHVGYLRVLLDEARGDEALDASSQTLTLAVGLASVVSRHAVAEGQLTGERSIVADSADGYRSTEAREVARRTAREAVGDDGLGIDVADATYSLLGQEGRRGADFLGVGHFIVVVQCQVSLCLTYDTSHGLYSLEGVLTVGRFAREHDSVGAIVDGVGDVADLCTGGQGIVDHRVEHLRSDDDGLLGIDALLDDHALDAGHFFCGDFDSEVTASDHDTGAVLDDLIDVVDTFLVLDLGDDLDLALVLVEDRLDLSDVLLVADEGVRDEVDVVVLEAVQDVVAVLLGQRGQVDADAGDVDTLAAAELTVVLAGSEELVAFLLLYVEGKGTVVDEDTCADGDILNEVHVVDIDRLVVGLSLGVRHEDDLIPSLELALDLGIPFEDGRTYLGALGVEQDCDVGRYSARVVDDARDAFEIHVCRVHTHNIDTSLYEGTDELYVTTQVGDGGYDLSSLHNSYIIYGFAVAVLSS